MSTTIHPVKIPESRVRAERVGAAIIVESKTIGTDIRYKLETENISKSGMLLSWKRNTKIPFGVNTILEMKIDPQGSWFGSPVSCLGKVVRCQNESEESKNKVFGIRIVQINNEDMAKWEVGIQDFSSDSGTSHMVVEDKVIDPKYKKIS